MTCLATDVYPVPSYVWGDIQCDNGNTGSTCTFTPHSPTHITEARCFVSHKGFGNTVALKKVQLNFKCEFILSICFVYFDCYYAHDQNQMNCIGKYLCYKLIGYLNVTIRYLSMYLTVNGDNNEDANCALWKVPIKFSFPRFYWLCNLLFRGFMVASFNLHGCDSAYRCQAAEYDFGHRSISSAAPFSGIPCLVNRHNWVTTSAFKTAPKTHLFWTYILFLIYFSPLLCCAVLCCVVLSACMCACVQIL